MSKKDENRIEYQQGKTKISGPSRQVLPLAWFVAVRPILRIAVLLLVSYVEKAGPIVSFLWEWIKRLHFLILLLVVVDCLLLQSG